MLFLLIIRSMCVINIPFSQQYNVTKYRKWVFLVDSKCRNTVILTGLTYTSSRKVFHDGCAKRGFFPHQIWNKNSLSLAHCALNRSFTVLVRTQNSTQFVPEKELSPTKFLYLWFFLPCLLLIRNILSCFCLLFW